ncbi:MAG TPA: SDR family oxidoreductase [Verrucomicrobiae bacterium]|jgi:nucleoside-diphosphate-sugar epimerase
MRVLIIGCGYVGLPLGAELVRRGHKVSGLRRNRAAAAEMNAAGIKPLFADITNAGELASLRRDFDWVVNCVASGGGAEDYRRVYLEGMRNLIEWLAPDRRDSWRRAAGAPRFVYTSSTSVYGQNDGSIVDEKSPAEGTMDTARVLLETERALLEGARERNFPAMILRVAGIYGPGRGHWFRQFLQGDARIEGKGERILNMIHRDDVVGCVIAALERGKSGEIYNAADDESVSQFDFFSWLAAVTSRPMPAAAPENAAVARKRGVTNKRISNRKLKTELDYRFKYPTFREGYAEEIKTLLGALKQKT